MRKVDWQSQKFNNSGDLFLAGGLGFCAKIADASICYPGQSTPPNELPEIYNYPPRCTQTGHRPAQKFYILLRFVMRL